MIDLVREARSSSREEFVNKHGGFYLVPPPRARRARAQAATVPKLPALAPQPTAAIDADPPVPFDALPIRAREPERPVHVGRTDENDVVLGEPSVSRRHAAFVVHGDRLEIVDLGSRHGTKVRGIPLRAGESQRLAAGDAVAFGGLHLIVADAGMCWDALNAK